MNSVLIENSVIFNFADGKSSDEDVKNEVAAPSGSGTLTSLLVLCINATIPSIYESLMMCFYPMNRCSDEVYQR
jgi:hypothetical protein